MKRRKHQKPDQHFVSTEKGLAAAIGFLFRRPVGGEMFFLTSPFIERFWGSAASGARVILKNTKTMRAARRSAAPCLTAWTNLPALGLQKANEERSPQRVDG